MPAIAPGRLGRGWPGKPGAGRLEECGSDITKRHVAFAGPQLTVYAASDGGGDGTLHVHARLSTPALARVSPVGAAVQVVTPSPALHTPVGAAALYATA